MALETRTIYSTEVVRDSKGKKKKEERYTLMTLAICQQDAIKQDTPPTEQDPVSKRYSQIIENYVKEKSMGQSERDKSKRDRTDISSLINQQTDKYYQIDEALNYFMSENTNQDKSIIIKELQFNIDILLPNPNIMDDTDDDDDERFIQYHRTFKYPTLLDEDDSSILDIDKNATTPHLYLKGMPTDDWLNWLYKLFIVGCFDFDYEFEITKARKQTESINLVVKRDVEGSDKTFFKIGLNKLPEVNEEAIDQVADLEELYAKSLRQSKLIEVLSSEIKTLIKHQLDFDDDRKKLELINQNLQYNLENVLIPMINNGRQRLNDLMNEKKYVNGNKIDFSSFKENVIYAKGANGDHETPGSSHVVSSDTSIFGSANSTPRGKKRLRFDGAEIKKDLDELDFDELEKDLKLSDIDEYDDSPKKKQKTLPIKKTSATRGRGGGRGRGRGRGRGSTSTRGRKRKADIESEDEPEVQSQEDNTFDEIDELTTRKSRGTRSYQIKENKSYPDTSNINSTVNSLPNPSSSPINSLPIPSSSPVNYLPNPSSSPLKITKMDDDEVTETEASDSDEDKVFHPQCSPTQDSQPSSSIHSSPTPSRKTVKPIQTLKSDTETSSDSNNPPRVLKAPASSSPQSNKLPPSRRRYGRQRIQTKQLSSSSSDSEDELAVPHTARPIATQGNTIKDDTVETETETVTETEDSDSDTDVS